MQDQAAYDGLDSQTLTNLLTNPGQRPDIHRAALSALSRRQPAERTRRLLDVLEAVIAQPDQYDQHVMMAAIDILATDPDPEATEAMVTMLPKVIQWQRKPGLINEFREYFCEALITRRREDDMAVWRSAISEFGPEMLHAMLFDPAAKSLGSLDPLRLMARLPSDQRSRALRGVFFRALFSRPDLAFSALRMLINPGKAATPKAASGKRTG